MNELESPRELSERIGWPERRIRLLVSSGELRHLRIGNRIFIPKGAVEEYIERKMVEPCYVIPEPPTSLSAKENRKSPWPLRHVGDREDFSKKSIHTA